MIEQESYITMPYLDASVVKDSFLNKERGFFGLVYYNRTAKAFYFAVLKLTNNAVKQLVVNMEIPLESDQENTHIRIATIDERRIGVFLLDKDQNTVSVFSFNEKGPIVYVKSLWDKVYINQVEFDINLTQESHIKAEHQILSESGKIQFKAGEKNDLSDLV